MNGHPRDQAKCPHMTGGRSSEGRVGSARRNGLYPLHDYISYIHAEYNTAGGRSRRGRPRQVLLYY